MPWPADVLELRSQHIAEAALPLILDGPRWRHRRVETLAPLSATTVRRSVSVDLTVPVEFHDGLRWPVDPGATGAGDQWVVPLGWLVRRPLVNFDLRDREGNALPLLLASQTAEIMRDLLLLAAVDAGLDLADEERMAGASEVVLDAAAASPPPADRPLITRAGALGLGGAFAELVRLSQAGFLLFAVVPEVRGRQLFKWRTDEFRRPARPGLQPVFVDTQVPGINEAASTHVELELPDALEAASFHLTDRRLSPGGRPGEPPQPVWVPLPHGERQPSTSAERPRMLLAPLADATDPYVRADVLIKSAEFLGPALVLVALAEAILLAGLATGVHDLAPAQRSTAPSLLLGAFSVGFGLFLRVEANPLVRALLARARIALGTAAVVIAAAGIPLALQLASGVVLAAWIVAAAVTFGALLAIAAPVATLTRWGRRFA